MDKEAKIQEGTVKADEKFRIVVSPRGPALVYGHPTLHQQFIMPDSEGSSWEFREGKSYSTEDEPTSLCRCGASKDKPYCDGAHGATHWNPPLNGYRGPLLEGAEIYDGPALQLSDNVKFCVFARFCDARGRVWNLIGRSDEEEAGKLAIREANNCPGGRLNIRNKADGVLVEPKYEPSLGLIEDPALNVSGGLWVRGGIQVRADDGFAYEVRNRVVLCRCGHSFHQPFCNGSHASVKFNDGFKRRNIK